MIILAELVATASAAGFSTTQPLNGCTFYKPRLVDAFTGCAEFSAVRGRHGCHKVKCFGPVCTRYPGDDVAMWLPDYYIEVTKHVGRSMFAESADGAALAGQLSLGTAWWQSVTKAAIEPMASNGSASKPGPDSFWHARILTVPYGAAASTYTLGPSGDVVFKSEGVPLPTCFAGASEFLASQWAFNLADGPFAVLWAPIGAPLCLSILGGGAVAGVDEAKRQVSGFAGSVPSMPSMPAGNGCATPVGIQEALAKNALPSSDTLSPLSDLSRLCMGSWGNLVPRTGWIATDDPYMSALSAAYKFQSLAGDMHLGPALKLRADDKWQIVYPPRAAHGCFRPGSPVGAAASGGDDPGSRTRDEFGSDKTRTANTYVIAVWRRRSSCQEPLGALGLWHASYKSNFIKNKGLCQAVPSL